MKFDLFQEKVHVKNMQIRKLRGQLVSLGLSAKLPLAVASALYKLWSKCSILKLGGGFLAVGDLVLCKT